MFDALLELKLRQHWVTEWPLEITHLMNVSRVGVEVDLLSIEGVDVSPRIHTLKDEARVVRERVLWLSKRRRIVGHRNGCIRRSVLADPQHDPVEIFEERSRLTLVPLTKLKVFLDRQAARSSEVLVSDPLLEL